MEGRIRTLREEIDALSPWGAGATIRLEEIWRLERRAAWLRKNAREEAAQAGFVDEAPGARAPERQPG